MLFEQGCWLIGWRMIVPAIWRGNRRCRRSEGAWRGLGFWLQRNETNERMGF